jgi:hypothetical protein
LNSIICFQRRKITIGARALFATINASFGVHLCNFPFPGVAHEALDIQWTTDPFDRIIVAHARANGTAPLITRDQLIRKNYPAAVWQSGWQPADDWESESTLSRNSPGGLAIHRDAIGPT